MSSEGVPHQSIIDDEYNGFYIPKGTITIGNAWLVQLLISYFCPEYIYIFKVDIERP
jgi:hypothetical protein